MPYTAACIHKALTSDVMSPNTPPRVLSFMKPCMPYVDGKRQANHCHISGILLLGHDTPDIKRKGTDVKTTNSITFSRWRTKNENVIEKKMQASR